MCNQKKTFAMFRVQITKALSIRFPKNLLQKFSSVKKEICNSYISLIIKDLNLENKINRWWIVGLIIIIIKAIWIIMYAYIQNFNFLWACCLQFDNEVHFSKWILRAMFWIMHSSINLVFKMTALFLNVKKNAKVEKQNH